MTKLSEVEFKAVELLAQAGVKVLRVRDDFYCRWTRHMADAICKSQYDIGSPTNFREHITRAAPDESILTERRGNGYFYCGLSVRREAD